jgi:hypothetical protein
MRTVLKTLIVCTTSLWAIATKADTAQQFPVTTDNTLIAEVSADPIAPSGVLATAVEIAGTSGGVRSVYYVPYMSVGQPKPKVGETCKVSWRWHDDFGWLTAKGSAQGVRLVTNFSCEKEHAVNL